jgi:hypothetical protein
MGRSVYDMFILLKRVVSRVTHRLLEIILDSAQILIDIRELQSKY